MGQVSSGLGQGGSWPYRVPQSLHLCKTERHFGLPQPLSSFPTQLGQSFLCVCVFPMCQCTRSWSLIGSVLHTAPGTGLSPQFLSGVTPRFTHSFLSSVLWPLMTRLKPLVLPLFPLAGAVAGNCAGRCEHLLKAGCCRHISPEHGGFGSDGAL